MGFVSSQDSYSYFALGFDSYSFSQDFVSSQDFSSSDFDSYSSSQDCDCDCDYEQILPCLKNFSKNLLVNR